MGEVYGGGGGGGGGGGAQAPQAPPLDPLLNIVFLSLRYFQETAIVTRQ